VYILLTRNEHESNALFLPGPNRGG
jgi:hypothetical protein